MSDKTIPQLPTKQDPLGDYVASAGRLHGKLALIAAHQRESASSLSRAAANLRAMAEGSRRQRPPEIRKSSLTSENLSEAST